MRNLSRIGISIDSELLGKFDYFIAAKGHENRSEAFRDLIRDRLVDLPSFPQPPRSCSSAASLQQYPGRDSREGEE